MNHLKISLFKKRTFMAILMVFFIFFGNNVWAQTKKDSKKLETIKQKKKESSGKAKSNSNKGEADASRPSTDIKSATKPFIVNKKKSRSSPDNEDKQKIINQKTVKKNQPSSAKGVDHQGDLKTKQKVKSSHKGQTFTGNQPVQEKNVPNDLNRGSQKSIDDYEPYSPNKRLDSGSKFSGKEKTKSLKAKTEDAKSNSSIIHQHQGNLKVEKKVKSDKGTEFSGPIKAKSQKSKIEDARTNSIILHQHQGDHKVIKKENNFKGSLYSGSLKAPSMKSKSEEFKILSSIINEYQGNIKIKEKDINLKGSVYRGNLKATSTKSKEAYYKKLSSKAHQFEGNIKIKDKSLKSKGTMHMGDLIARSQKSKAAYYKKLSTKAHQYGGDIVLKKPTKDMHPSANYKNAKNIKSIDQKEKKRKRSLWWFRNNYDSDQPKSLKQKEKKPRHDKKESTIWY